MLFLFGFTASGWPEMSGHRGAGTQSSLYTTTLNNDDGFTSIKMNLLGTSEI